MSTEWISPKTIIGSAATGDYYYPRNEIVEEIWDELEKGNFILIAAPRRVGKTSIMKDIEANPRKNYKVKFESIQAVKSEIDFYKTLYKLILNCLNTSRKAKKQFVNYLKSKNITEITTEGIKIGNVDLNYLDEINSIFSQLGNNTDSVILLLDELPEVLYRLHKNGKKDEAIAILNQLRTWRQSGIKKLQFVFAGSIGIHYVVKAIEGRTAGLNDLKKVICNPLIEKEPHNYIEWATSGATIQYSETLKSYLLQKIQYYYTPYFINLMLDEIHRKAKKAGNLIITEQDIDEAFLNVEKSNEHFADWKSRLKDYMPKLDFEFVNEILIHTAHKDSISIQTIYDKSVKHEMPDGYMDLINDLEQDGYFVETIEGSHNYVFISPFLKAFWKRNNPIYHE